MKIAYFINQYPKVSHSFIRREILALERQGVEVLRIALRGWDAGIVDSEDLQEREKTRFVLREGIIPLMFSALRTSIATPRRFFSALLLAMKMSSEGGRSFLYHLAYLAEACRIVPWLRDFGASHLHAHFGTNSAEVAMLARILGGPPFSMTVHGPEEFDKPISIHLSEKIRRARFVVSISSYGRSQVFRWVEHAYWPNVKVVHCGLEPAFYDGVPPAPIPDAPRLVCIGRLCEQKGQLLLLEAARKLKDQNIQFELVLAGDGEMRGEIEHLIDTYGLRDYVRITGWISSAQVRAELLAARGLVLPSFAEGLPVVIMESLALRRPVISTFVAGIPELVRHGENGWLIPPGAVEPLAEAMIDCISATPDRLQELGNAGRLRVIERHSVDIEAKKLVQLFAECASAGAGKPISARVGGLSTKLEAR
jgi:colanic acid/amylovoran biosynthesis glycosyltransferase